MYSVKATDVALKAYESLGKKTKEKVDSVIETIRENPLYGKPLTGPLKGQRSVRIRRAMRFIYSFDPDSKVIVWRDLQHRKDAYKKR